MTNHTSLVVSSEIPDCLSIKLIDQAYEATCRALKWQPSGQVLLAFVTKQQIRKFNKQYADNNYATDVLSFSYNDNNDNLLNKSMKNHLAEGEIIICPAIANNNAIKHQVSLESELILLLVHGLIHLSGADHQKYHDQTSFASLQNGIMKTLKLNFHPMIW